jgi:hypothetical protein
MSSEGREGGVGKATWAWFTALMVLSGALLLVGLGDVGMWEPWEASELSVAREYATRGEWDASAAQADPRAPGYNWAVPTVGGQPVAYSLLKVWAVGALLPPAGAPIEEVIGELERGARLPAALALWVLCGALFWSVRRRFGDMTGWLAGVAFATLPVTYVGARSLATEQLFVVTTSLAMLAFFELTRASGRARWGWAAAAAAASCAAFLDQRLVGLLVPLYALGVWAVVSAVLEGERAGVVEKAVAAAALLAPAAPVLSTGGLSTASAWLDVEHHAQLTFLGFALGGVVALGALGWRSQVGRALASAPGALALGAPLALGAWVLHAYGAVNPTLLEGGEVVGAIPSLAFALEHELFGKSVASGGHVHFDLWLRQVGFAMLPWAALAPAGVGYMAWLGGQEGERAAYARMALCWAAAGLFVVAAASVWGHVFFPAYAPLALGAALMLTDRGWWERAREEPLVAMGVGFSAVAIVLMLGKDVERYPHRFFELYVAMESKLEFPEGFTYGGSFKAMKYVWALALAAPVFGFGTWAALNARRVFVELPRAWRAEREGAVGVREKVSAAWGAVWGVSGLGERAPMVRQLELKRELRASEGRVGAALRWLEEAPRFGLLWAGLFVVSAGVFAHVYVPKVALHLSQRHVFETYLERAASTQTEPLYRHQTPRGEGTLYLADVPELGSTRAFMERFEQEERFFAVIPRDRLAALHYEARRKAGRDLPVVDASGSKLVLVSNTLGEGEVDESPIGEAIVDDPGSLEIQYPVEFAGEGGEKERLTFDGKLEFLGYSLDREGEGGAPPGYAWGDEIEMTLYFEVKGRVSGNQKLFVHIDTPGNRIHGDHYPVGGAFPTNYWPVGAVVADTHKIKVGSYAKRGSYSINFGWFMGSKRMKAAPRSAHDGKNRVKIGELTVGP